MKHLLVVRVDRTVAEFAADLLWSAGAQAVEERLDGEMVDLVTDLGDDPVAAWRRHIAEIPDADTWPVTVLEANSDHADSWRAYAGPTTVGTVRIVPSWLDEARRDNDILIDPGGSFGMGDHPTTRATLELALGLSAESVLDLGCGSGVLGIALALRDHCSVLAVDPAPAATLATRANALLNGVADLVRVVEGDASVVVGNHELVLANILAPVLLADAARIVDLVTPGGHVVLSGFTEARRADITAKYEGLGCRLVRTVEIDGWYALLLQRDEPSASTKGEKSSAETWRR